LLLGVAPDEEYTDLPALQEIGTNRSVDEDTDERWRRAGVHVYTMRNESHWSASLAEFAIGMTIASLRRIPHLHHAVHHSPSCWDYSPRRDQSGAYIRATQFGDAVKFVGGTIAGKRVRVGGLGNIGARYAAACRFLGADVAAWDPMAADSVFLSHGIRRVHHQAELFADADIAAPMMPERPQTKGLFDAASIDSIPRGALLLLVTRAGICDMDRVRHRVISGELALAADVFDVEPIPLDDPLLSLDHVVVTPHVAGRTRHANEQYAEQLLDQFRRTP
jgi:phosphoglycerate dehydrogenase-like enzyme